MKDHPNITMDCPICQLRWCRDGNHIPRWLNGGSEHVCLCTHADAKTEEEIRNDGAIPALVSIRQAETREILTRMLSDLRSELHEPGRPKRDVAYLRFAGAVRFAEDIGFIERGEGNEWLSRCTDVLDE